MKILALPGGSTKGFQIALACKELYTNDYSFDLILTNSVSSLIALAQELGKFDEVLYETKDVELNEIFEQIPTDGKGNLSFRAKYRTIKGLLGFKNNYSFGIQNTRHFITNNISEKEYNDYKLQVSHNLKPDIVVFTTDPSVAEPRWYKLSTLNYYEYIEVCEASAHIPVMTEAININNQYNVDGGLYAHNPEWVFLENWSNIIDKKPTDIISIYPREKIFNKDFSLDWKKNVFNNLDNTIKCFNIALSSAGERHAYWYCKANNIKHLQLYCPNIMNSRYDVDDEDFDIAELKTINSIKKQLNERES